MRDRREETIQQYREWLERYRWAWYCTLKITSGIPSDRRARKMFDKWISNLRRVEGGEDFRWFRVQERGIGGNNLHFHVLIGGLRNRIGGQRNRRKVWEQKWNELGGNALITPFDPEQKGILYLLKGMSKDGDLDFDCQFPPKKKSGDGAVESFEWKKIKPSTVLVQRIDDKTTLNELRSLFKPYGTITEIEILETGIERDRTQISATITFDNSFAASFAIDGLNQADFRDSDLWVSLLK